MEAYKSEFIEFMLLMLDKIFFLFFHKNPKMKPSQNKDFYL